MRVKKNNTRSLVKHLETLVQGVKNQLESDYQKGSYLLKRNFMGCYKMRSTMKSQATIS